MTDFPTLSDTSTLSPSWLKMLALLAESPRMGQNRGEACVESTLVEPTCEFYPTYIYFQNLRQIAITFNDVFSATKLSYYGKIDRRVHFKRCAVI